MCDTTYLDALVGVLSLLLVVSEGLAFHKSSCNGLLDMFHQYLGRNRCRELPDDRDLVAV